MKVIQSGDRNLWEQPLSHFLPVRLGVYVLFLAALTSCAPGTVATPAQGTSTSVPTDISNITPSLSAIPTNVKVSSNQIAYGQWDKHYRYFDLLWFADSDGSQRHIPFEWLTFTDGYTFLPNRSDMLVWVSEDLAGVSGRYIHANPETTMPDSCVTCSIKDEMYMDTPVPSLRGEAIAIVANTGLYVSNSDGTYSQKIIQEDNNVLYISGPPSWSPDGNELTIGLLINGHGDDVFKVKKNGTDLVNLTEGQSSELDFASPQWSPLGDRIAYIGGDQTIRTMKTDGTDVQILSTLISHTEVWSAGTYDAPQWSPDGSKLLFYSAVEEGGKADIILINADGSGWINLTNTPDANDWGPVWSPDGSQIAFITNRDGNSEIYVMNADGSDPVNISQSPDTAEGDPKWRP